MTLHEAARLAREKADRSIDPADHALANALEAAVRAEADAALRDALTETGPTDDIPPWSEVSKPPGED